MKARELGKLSGQYFVAIGVIFISCAVFRTRILDYFVTAWDGLPVPLVVVLSWLPAGGGLVLLALTALGWIGKPAHPAWLIVLAGLGLVVVAQFPVVLARHPGREYQMLADTAVGSAIIAGAWSAYYSVMAFWAIVLGVVWLFQKIFRPKAERSNPSKWAAEPGPRRRILVGAALAAIGGLAIALASA